MTKDSPRNSVLRDEELVKRLRAGTGGGKHWMDLHEEAADRIEALIKELNDAVESVSNNNDWFGCCMDVWSWLISQPDMPDLDLKEGGADECVENYKIAITSLIKTRAEQIAAKQTLDESL